MTYPKLSSTIASWQCLGTYGLCSLQLIKVDLNQEDTFARYAWRAEYRRIDGLGGRLDLHRRHCQPRAQCRLHLRCRLRF